MSTVMATSHKSNSIKFVSPIQWVCNKYQNMINVNTFKTHFADRNDPKVLLPFLKSIQVDYLQLNQLLLVKMKPGILDQIVDQLKFEVSETSEEYKSPILKKLAKVYYNYDFNIEIMIIPTEDWPLVTTANTIMTDLQVHGEKNVKVFLTVLTSLHNISNTKSI